MRGRTRAIAENVLLGDERDVVRLEAGFETDHREHRLVARRCLHHAPGVDVGGVEQLVVFQHARHAVAGAFAPQRDDDLLAGRLQAVDVSYYALEDVDVAVGPLRREIAALSRIDIDDACVIRRKCKWREAREALS